ncbi:MAG: DedA family protein [Alphaproteobacteria bacterium]
MLEQYLSTYGYLAILLITFLEGESIVILAGVFAYQGLLELPMVAAAAFTGSFLGDQFYFSIGRRYGQPLLQRWPDMTARIEWAFRLLRRYETVFILSFRFIYGVRNVSPFVIGMSAIPRLKFILLNMLAAIVWALSFSIGGYYFGHALERVVGEHQAKVLWSLVGLVLVVGVVTLVRRTLRRRKLRQEAKAESGAATE